MAFFSSVDKHNPNLQDFLVYIFCYDKKRKIYLTENGENIKNMILHNISPYITED